MERRDALKTMAAAVALPQAHKDHQRPAATAGPAAAAPAAPDWTPRAFDEHQNRTVVALAELIIPRTDTPGATDAQVNRYIDLMLADSAPSVRREFINGLGWLDGYCNANHGAPFADLPAEKQTAVLALLSTNPPAELAPGARFFRTMKSMTATGYYTSQAGLEQELGWGRSGISEPPGCTHPGGHAPR